MLKKSSGKLLGLQIKSPLCCCLSGSQRDPTWLQRRPFPCCILVFSMNFLWAPKESTRKRHVKPGRWHNSDHSPCVYGLRIRIVLWSSLGKPEWFIDFLAIIMPFKSSSRENIKSYIYFGTCPNCTALFFSLSFGDIHFSLSSASS